jgi:nitroimidazol reductase NimA-like FMN-containing flavoprotein (pyridoxamine 5'-phosphate oxidase superfamily)
VPAEELTRERCLELLEGEVLGRLAVVVGGRPDIMPVNYLLDGEGVVIRTAEGTKLKAASGAPVAFEVDEVDRDLRSGWSVVVHGIAHEIRSLGRDEITARMLTLPVDPWAGGDKPFLLRIAPLSITGRLITPEPPV